jgi:hypothetical protein
MQPLGADRRIRPAAVGRPPEGGRAALQAHHWTGERPATMRRIGSKRATPWPGAPEPPCLRSTNCTSLPLLDSLASLECGLLRFPQVAPAMRTLEDSAAVEVSPRFQRFVLPMCRLHKPETRRRLRRCFAPFGGLERVEVSCAAAHGALHLRRRSAHTSAPSPSVSVRSQNFGSTAHLGGHTQTVGHAGRSPW